MHLLPTIVIVSVLGFFIILTLLCILWHWKQSRVRYSNRSSGGHSYQTPPVRRLTIQGGRVVDVSNSLEKGVFDDDQAADEPYPTLHAFVDDPPGAEARVDGAQIRQNRAKLEINPEDTVPGQKVSENARGVSGVSSHDSSRPIPSIKSAHLTERSGSLTLPRPALINIEKKGSTRSSSATREKKESRLRISRNGSQKSTKERQAKEHLEVPESPLKLGIAHIFPSSSRSSVERSVAPGSHPHSPVSPIPPVPPLPPTESASTSRTASQKVNKPPPIPPNPRTSSRSSSAKRTPPAVPSPRRTSYQQHRPPPLDLKLQKRTKQYDPTPSLEPSPRKSWHSSNKRPPVPSPRRNSQSSKRVATEATNQRASLPFAKRPPINRSSKSGYIVRRLRPHEINSWASPPSVEAPPPVKVATRASMPAVPSTGEPSRISFPPAQPPPPLEAKLRAKRESTLRPLPPDPPARESAHSLQPPPSGSTLRTSLQSLQPPSTGTTLRMSSHSDQIPAALLHKPIATSPLADRPLSLATDPEPISSSAEKPPLPEQLVMPPATLLNRRAKPDSPSMQRPAPLDLNPEAGGRVRFAQTWEVSRQSFLSVTESPLSASVSSLEPTSPEVRAPPPSTTELPQFQTPPPPTPKEIEAELEPEMVARLDRPPSIDVDIPHLSTFSSFFGTPNLSEHHSSDLHRGPSVLSNRSGITIASSEISSNWTIGNAQLVNIYPSVGEASSSLRPQEERHTPPYAKTLRSKYGRYPRGRRDKALPTLPKSPLSMTFSVNDEDDDQPGRAV